MDVIVSVWKSPDGHGHCEIENITVTDEDIEAIAVAKYRKQFGEHSLYHWQIEHIIP